MHAEKIEPTKTNPLIHRECQVIVGVTTTYQEKLIMKKSNLIQIEAFVIS